MKIFKRSSQQGFSLTELIIALGLGVALSTGLFQLLINSNQLSRSQESLARLQENGRFAMNFITQDIRMAGFRGETPDTTLAVIQGFEATAAIWSPPIVIAGAVNGSDIVTVSSFYDGEANPYINRTFYIGTRAGANVPSLFRRDNGGALTELIEGVAQMQVLYGEDIDYTPTNPVIQADYYVPANQVVNMNNVVSVRVSILLSTLEDNISTAPIPYTLLGVVTTPADRRMYRVLTSTIALRNRLQ